MTFLSDEFEHCTHAWPKMMVNFHLSQIKSLQMVSWANVLFLGWTTTSRNRASFRTFLSIAWHFGWERTFDSIHLDLKFHAREALFGHGRPKNSRSRPLMNLYLWESYQIDIFNDRSILSLQFDNRTNPAGWMAHWTANQVWYLKIMWKFLNENECCAPFNDFKVSYIYIVYERQHQ